MKMVKDPHKKTNKIKVVGKHQKGFTLVEALVALVILTVTLSSIWEWLSSARLNTEKLQANAQLTFVASQFEQFLRHENLPPSNSGTYKVGEFEIRYRGELARSNQTDKYRKQLSWIVQLYDINADVYLNDQALVNWQTKKVQYIPDPDYVPPFEQSGR